MTPVVKTVMKWGVLAALLAYCVGMGVWASTEAARTKCTDIRVMIPDATPADSVAREGVRQELATYPGHITGVNVGKVDIAGIETYLSRLNNLENVECAISTDGCLFVYVEPMRPEIRVFESSGKSYYINKDGKRMDAKAEFFADVPVVYGDFTPDFPATAVLPVTRFVSRDPSLSRLISAVEARDAHNILLVPRIRGHIVNFGDTSRLERKRDALLTAYRRILPYRGWMTYDTISVKFKDQIVATRRDKTPVGRETDSGTEDIDLEEATLPAPDTATAHSPATQPQSPTHQ
ncbi:MAG: hypothetical protein K2O24_01950 [Muribaculaceae bacterium]|nr:hypothetical protein [Muribaculaceae bacterium]